MSTRPTIAAMLLLLVTVLGCASEHPQPADIEKASPRLRGLYHLMISLRAQEPSARGIWFVGVLSSGSQVEMYSWSFDANKLPGGGFQIFYSENMAESGNQAVVVSLIAGANHECRTASSIYFWSGHSWYDPADEIRQQLRDSIQKAGSPNPSSAKN